MTFEDKKQLNPANVSNIILTGLQNKKYCSIYVEYNTCVMWCILHCYVIAELQPVTLLQKRFSVPKETLPMFLYYRYNRFLSNYYCVFSHDFHHKRFNFINKGGGFSKLKTQQSVLEQRERNNYAKQEPRNTLTFVIDAKLRWALRLQLLFFGLNLTQL